MYHQQSYSSSSRGNVYSCPPSLMSQQVVSPRQGYSRSEIERGTRTLARDNSMYSGTGGEEEYQMYDRFYTTYEGNQRRHSAGAGMYHDVDTEKQSGRQNYETGRHTQDTARNMRKQQQSRSRQPDETRQSQMSYEKQHSRNSSSNITQHSDRYDRNNMYLPDGKVFWCKVCKISIRNITTFGEHVRGKKHAMNKIDMRRKLGAQFDRLFPDDPEIRNEEIILPRDQRPPSPPPRSNSRTSRSELRRDTRDTRGTTRSNAPDKESVSKAAQLLLTMGNLAKISSPSSRQRSHQEQAYPARGRQEPSQSWRDPPQRESRDGKLATMGKMLDAVGVKDEQQLSQLVAAAVRNVSASKSRDRGNDRDRQRSRIQQDQRQRERSRDRSRREQLNARASVSSLRDRSPLRDRSSTRDRQSRERRRSEGVNREGTRDSDRRRARTSSGRGRSPSRNSPKSSRTEDSSSITVNLEELEIAQQIGMATGIQNMALLLQLVKVVKKLGPGGMEVLTKWTKTFQAYISKVLTLEELARKLPKKLGDVITDGTLKPELIHLFFGGNDQMLSNVSGSVNAMPFMMQPGMMTLPAAQGMGSPVIVPGADLMGGMAPGVVPLLSPEETERNEVLRRRELRRIREERLRERSIERRRRARERRHRELRRRALQLAKKRNEKNDRAKDSKGKESKDSSKGKDEKKTEKTRDKTAENKKEGEKNDKEISKDCKEKPKVADKKTERKSTRSNETKKGTSSSHAARIKQRYSRQNKGRATQRAEQRKKIAEIRKIEKKPALKLDKTDIKTVVEQLKKAARKIDTSKK